MDDSLSIAARQVANHIDKSAKGTTQGRRRVGGTSSNALEELMGSDAVVVVVDSSVSTPPKNKEGGATKKKKKEEEERREGDSKTKKSKSKHVSEGDDVLLDQSRVATPAGLPPPRRKRLGGKLSKKNLEDDDNNSGAGPPAASSPKRHQSPRGGGKSPRRGNVASEASFTFTKGAKGASRRVVAGATTTTTATTAHPTTASIASTIAPSGVEAPSIPPDDEDVILARDLISRIQQEIDELQVGGTDAWRKDRLIGELTAIMELLRQKFSMAAPLSSSSSSSSSSALGGPRIKLLQGRKAVLQAELDQWQAHLVRYNKEDEGGSSPATTIIDWKAEMDKIGGSEMRQKDSKAAVAAVRSLVEAGAVVLTMKTQVDGIAAFSKRVQELQEDAASTLKKRTFNTSEFESGTPRKLIKGSSSSSSSKKKAKKK